MVRRFLLVLAIATTSCATGGYEILSGTKTPTASVGSAVMLYGVDTTTVPPPGCRTLGTIRAWSFGEKTFPYDQLRAAASELGGDSVLDIHADPSATDPKRPTSIGTVARCN